VEQRHGERAVDDLRGRGLLKVEVEMAERARDDSIVAVSPIKATAPRGSGRRIVPAKIANTAQPSACTAAGRGISRISPAGANGATALMIVAPAGRPRGAGDGAAGGTAAGGGGAGGTVTAN
jgi:hypothetical protein